MLKEDAFRSQAIRVGELAPIFCHFQRVGQTAGFGVWTHYQPTDGVETIRKGFDAFTLLLSGVSDEADAGVLTMFENLVTAPVITTPEFTSQDYKIPPAFVDAVRAERRPVGITVYIRPVVVQNTGITSATAAMVGAFFALLGAEQRGLRLCNFTLCPRIQSATAPPTAVRYPISYPIAPVFRIQQVADDHAYSDVFPESFRPFCKPRVK